MTRLILIRHGETDYNLQNKYCGFSDPPLNNKGIWQVEKLACVLQDIKVNRVYSSDLKRAYETAKITFKNNPIEKSADFREMNFGIFEGLKYEEIIQNHPNLYKNWLDNPTMVKIPEGERLTELRKRVREKLSLILVQHRDETVALITHGGPIRVILCDALKFGLNVFWKIEQNVGALNIVDYPKSLPPIVAKMNDTSHLTIPEEITL